MSSRLRLKDKVAIITGAGSGIGKAAALLFASEGAKVVVADCVSNAGKETVGLIGKHGYEATFVRANISSAYDALNIVKRAVETYGRLDILYNNAGIVGGSSLVDCSEEEWDRFLDTNLKGTFLCSKYAILEMAKRGKGSVINTGSEMGMIGCDGAAAYCASKAGVINLTRSMASEYTQSGIRVNCISPGTVATRSRSPDENQQIVSRVCPSGRLGQPEEIAYVALFLASDESSFISGANIEVGGGAPLCRVPKKKYLR